MVIFVPKKIMNMKGNYRCIAPDYPGFGLSNAPTGYDFLPNSHARVICEFVEKLKLNNFDLVMQDWGGANWPMDVTFV